jgi:uncharacterized protein
MPTSKKNLKDISETFHFPLGLAQGEYFCNRVSETARLIKNLQSHTHTLLIAPRRYGKTSLAYRAIHLSQLPSTKIDLYMSTSLEDIQKAILKGINELIAETTGVTEKLLESIKGFVKSLKLSLEATSEGFKISLTPGHNSTPSQNICEALQILDQVLIKKDLSAALLIDEFQEIERVAPNQGIEGAIRHVAQEAQRFSIIFSGSHQTLLKSMFNSKNKPLYRLCDEITLTRITEEDYETFVNQFAQKKWDQPLKKAVFQELTKLTQCHPYYFNALLREVFHSETLPTTEMLSRLWEDLAHKKRQDLLTETENLNLTQKKLLVAIAHGINSELTSKEFLSKFELASSSVLRALYSLIESDLVEIREEKYHLIDPLLESVILKQVSL